MFHIIVDIVVKVSTAIYLRKRGIRRMKKCVINEKLFYKKAQRQGKKLFYSFCRFLFKWLVKRGKRKREMVKTSFISF